MSEPKRGPGRPAYTPEERREASDASFERAKAVIPGTECEITRSDHIVGYDGSRVRMRTFAWNYYHPDQPATGMEIIKLCHTKGCVAKEHMTLSKGSAKVEKSTVDALTAPKMDPRIETYVHKKIRDALHDPLILEDQLKLLREAYQECLVLASSEDAQRRIDFALEVAPDELADMGEWAKNWGVIDD